jgi:hypothetical protein
MSGATVIAALPRDAARMLAVEILLAEPSSAKSNRTVQELTNKGCQVSLSRVDTG